MAFVSKKYFYDLRIPIIKWRKCAVYLFTIIKTGWSDVNTNICPFFKTLFQKCNRITLMPIVRLTACNFLNLLAAILTHHLPALICINRVHCTRRENSYRSYTNVSDGCFEFGFNDTTLKLIVCHDFRYIVVVKLTIHVEANLLYPQSNFGYREI